MRRPSATPVSPTALQKFTLFKADNTKASPALQAVMERFEIKGLPTVVFLGADGQEVRQARLEEFEAPDSSSSASSWPLIPAAAPSRSCRGELLSRRSLTSEAN